MKEEKDILESFISEDLVEGQDSQLNVDKKEEEPLIQDATFLTSVPKLITDLSSEKNSIDWILEGFIAKGHVTIFSALPKAGKTTWTTHFLKSLKEEILFMGKRVKHCNVLIISEESEALWFRRHKDFELNSNIWIWSNPIKQKMKTNEWNSFLEYVSNFSSEKKIDLVVVDTLSAFWSVWKENEASEVQNALISLNHLKNKNIAILLIHHIRKSGGDEGAGTRGSGAIGAFVDIIVEFKRTEATNVNNTSRVLRCFSRFEETPDELVIELIEGKYIPRGTSQDVSKQKRIQYVIQILQESSVPLTTKELLEDWDVEEYGSKPTSRSVNNYLPALLRDGLIVITGEKKVAKTIAKLYTTPDKNVSSNEGKSSQQNISFEANNERKESGIYTEDTEI